jgi:hypothetical protein
MDSIQITYFQFWLFVVIQLLGFLAIYFKSYSNEKGKNLATKEDIGEITQIVESIKTSLIQETEELKSNLSYKNEHLIHLRASERSAIINYYKSTWALVLNLTRVDLIFNEIDYFDEKDGEIYTLTTRYISNSETSLNKIKEELSNLKYLRDLSESEVIFFYDEPDLTAILSELNLSFLEFERVLSRSIYLLLQVFTELSIKINNGQLTKETVIETKRKRSDILANWYEERRNNFDLIRTFNENLKKTLLKRLTSLTS